MQTIWGRAAQARTSCRCPSCSFQHRSVPRRRTTSSIAQHFYSSTTAFAVSFSTAVAGASYLDVRAKQKRRAALETGIAQARAEAHALREDQDARLRALGIDPAAAKKGKAAEPMLSDNQGKRISQIAPETDKQSYHPTIHSTSDHNASETLRQAPRREEDRDSAMGSVPMVNGRDVTSEVTSEKDAWGARSHVLYDRRVALMTEISISRLIQQLELLHAQLSDNTTPASPSSTKKPVLEAVAEQRLRDLDIAFKGLRESIWQSSYHKPESDERINDIQSNVKSADILRVHYDWTDPQAKQWEGNAIQEDLLLDLFAREHSAVDLIQELSKFLLSSTIFPSIHAFNIMVIGLCDLGLPCAARLVLEFLRRSPLEGNAITHEAAIRCALLDRDSKLFRAYYDNMKCHNKLGWHSGMEPNTGKKMPLFKHAKRLHHNFAPKPQILYQAPMTHAGAEAIIRGLLRYGRIHCALEEYSSFRKAGREPTMHLLESFLRCCFFTNNVQLALSTWKQIRTLSDKPPSSAYYWMLGILSRSSLKGAARPFSAEEKSLHAKQFKAISNEFAGLYDGTGSAPKWRWFVNLGVARRHLFRMAEKIEDLSVSQWLPNSDRESLPDLLDSGNRLSQLGHLDRPRTLGSYVRHQYTLLEEHAPCGVVVHRSDKHEQFFVALSKTRCATDINFRRQKATVELETQADAKPREAAVYPWIDPASDEEWEDLEEHVESRSVVPPVAGLLPIPVSTALPWRVPTHSLPLRLPRPYTLPPLRVGRHERLAIA